MQSLLASGLLLTLLAVPAEATPLPTLLQPYVKDGQFDPGDYEWMRGNFAEATPQQKAAAAEIRTWLDACFKAGMDSARAELKALGVTNPLLRQGAMRDPVCGAVASRPDAQEFSSFTDLRQAVATARPIADSFLFAVSMAEEVGGPRGPELRDKLLARPLGEQMLRFALGWGEGQMKGAPPLPPKARAVLVSRLGAALASRDHANTEWLKELVAKQGWPKISQVGGPAANQAWLLVQHADNDPAFQFRALRLMEPLVASGEVSKQNFAYLHDRVMLKINGKQRYGTQMTCRASKRVPQPLESRAAVEKLRKEVSLPTLEEYIRMIDSQAGPCPMDDSAAPQE